MDNRKMFDLENEGQSHGVQQLPCCHSMANINLYKSHTWAFRVNSHRFQDIHISECAALKM